MTGSKLNAVSGIITIVKRNGAMRRLTEVFVRAVSGTMRDPNGDPTRNGVAIEAHYFAKATLKHNTVVASPGGVAAFDQSTIER